VVSSLSCRCVASMTGVCLWLCSAVGRELMRPNMSAGGTCLSSLIAAPTFPRTVPRTSTLQRQSRTYVADNAVVDCTVPAAYNQRQLSQTLIDGSAGSPSQTVIAAATSRHAHQNAVDAERYVPIADNCIRLFIA